MNDVVDSVGPCLKAFLENVIRAEMPDCRYVFDPELSYETGIQRLRANNKMNELEGKEANKPLPLFIFKRTALMYPEEQQAPNMRSTHGSGFMKIANGKAAKYSFVHAEFSVDFLYVNPNMEMVERFEIAYLSKRGITGTTEFVVNLGDLGDFRYYLTWNDIIDVDMSTDTNYSKAIASTVKIRGFFFVFETEAKQILEIKQQIATFKQEVGITTADEVLSDITIVPP
jgi:hypothetical protein